MDDIQGYTMFGEGISGTLVGGPTQVTGKVGQALSIGSGQYIDFGVQNTNCAGKISLCTSGGGLTVALWFKLIDTGLVSTFNNNGGMRLFLQKYGSSIMTELHCVEYVWLITIQIRIVHFTSPWTIYKEPPLWVTEYLEL